MDTFVDSSWYYLRYTDPTNTRKFADPKKMNKWLPVPMYVGGSEHNTMHLLYSRFFAKVLFDLGYVHFNEPFLARRNHGFVLGPDGQKMSKSRGNVVDPDKEVARFGADAVRMYLAFLGPYDQDTAWDPKGINGVHRFLNRVWRLVHDAELVSRPADTTAEKAVNAAIKKVGQDLSHLHLNTAVSELMKTLNVLEGVQFTQKTLEQFLTILAPLAPHITEELWQGKLKKKKSIHLEAWPAYDSRLLIDSVVELPVQVNGKVRDVIMISPRALQDEAVFVARSSESVARHIEGKDIRKIIYIPGRMLNIVVTE